jgi:hypothetical protein
LHHGPSTEKLVCPLEKPVAVHREEVYKDIISLVKKLKEVDAASHTNLELSDLCGLIVNPGTKHVINT